MIGSADCWTGGLLSGPISSGSCDVERQGLAANDLVIAAHAKGPCRIEARGRLTGRLDGVAEEASLLGLGGVVETLGEVSGNAGRASAQLFREEGEPFGELLDGFSRRYHQFERLLVDDGVFMSHTPLSSPSAETLRDLAQKAGFSLQSQSGSPQSSVGELQSGHVSSAAKASIER